MVIDAVHQIHFRAKRITRKQAAKPPLIRCPNLHESREQLLHDRRNQAEQQIDKRHPNGNIKNNRTKHAVFPRNSVRSSAENHLVISAVGPFKPPTQKVGITITTLQRAS
jgi:hypothetical protein